jgi:hypothetical protein
MYNVWKNQMTTVTATVVIYRVFQKELYNFEGVYKFIQRTYTAF